MKKAITLISHLRRGKLYRRADLKQWSRSVDRELSKLVKERTLQKVATGIYHYPKTTAFGNAPPLETELIKTFLKSDKFLITSYNHFNCLGLGTTQLYNQKIVYNYSRSGEYQLGNRIYMFKKKNAFPDKLTKEFLLIDLLNNLSNLAEDQTKVLKNVFKELRRIQVKPFKKILHKYGTPQTKSLLFRYLG